MGDRVEAKKRSAGRKDGNVEEPGSDWEAGWIRIRKKLRKGSSWTQGKRKED